MTTTQYLHSPLRRAAGGETRAFTSSEMESISACPWPALNSRQIPCDFMFSSCFSKLSILTNYPRAVGLCNDWWVEFLLDMGQETNQGLMETDKSGLTVTENVPGTWWTELINRNKKHVSFYIKCNYRSHISSAFPPSSTFRQTYKCFPV